MYATYINQDVTFFYFDTSENQFRNFNLRAYISQDFYHRFRFLEKVWSFQTFSLNLTYEENDCMLR